MIGLMLGQAQYKPNNVTSHSDDWAYVIGPFKFLLVMSPLCSQGIDIDRQQLATYSPMLINN